MLSCVISQCKLCEQLKSTFGFCQVLLLLFEDNNQGETDLKPPQNLSSFPFIVSIAILCVCTCEMGTNI